MSRSRYNSLMKRAHIRVILATLPLVLAAGGLLLSGLGWPGDARAQTCTPELAEQKRSPCKKWRTKEAQAAMQTMRMDEVAADYRGQGTTVVHIETEIPWLDAAEFFSGERLFGDCSLPRDRSRDIDGYAPGGNSCRVKWTQCFGVNPFNQSNCEFNLGPRQGHATAAVQGLAMAAPEADIITLKLLAFTDEFFAEAIDWLLSPSEAFDGQSPAEHFNVVAVTVGWTVILHYTQTDPKFGIIGVFNEPCEVHNPNRGAGGNQLKYVSDWLVAHDVNTERFRYDAFATAARRLREAGIVPLAGAMNYHARSKSRDEQGREVEQKFVSPNGIAFPACLDSYLAVGGIAPNYQALQNRPSNRLRFMTTNAHPTLTDVVAPGGASSFSVPLAAAAIARLKSSALLPQAGFEDIVRLLRTTNNAPARAGFSCAPQTVFPPETEPAELGCPAELPDWTLPVIDMDAAVQAAERARDQ